MSNHSVAASILLAAICFPAITLAQCLLPLPRQYLVNGGAQSVITADLNNNGRIDLLPLVANAPWFELQPDGSLLQIGTYAGVGTSQGGVAADMNGDGVLDLIYTESVTNGAVRIALASSPGTYQPPVSYPGFTSPTSVIAADVTGDGFADVILRTSTGIVLLRNLGNGALDSAQVLVSGSHIGLVAVDLDSDGDREIVTTTLGGNSFIRILVNDSTGSFSSLHDISTVTSTRDLAVVDMNSDGRQDIVTAARDNKLVAVHLATPTPFTFVQSTCSVPANPIALSAVDADADGDIDVALVNEDTNGSITLLRNDGAGALSVSSSLVGSGPVLRSVATPQPGPGALPVIVAAGRMGLSVHQLAPAGQVQGTTYVSSRSQTSASVIADMNRDGRPDLVGLSRTRISIHFQQPDGTLSGPVQYAISNGGGFSSIFARDLNGDQYPDITFITGESQDVRVALNDGNGGLIAPVAFTSPHFVLAMIEIDVNQDGVDDFVSLPDSTRPSSLFVVQADGSLVREANTLNYPTASMVASDVNRDGILDLVACNGIDNFSRFVVVYPGRAQGGFDSFVGSSVTGPALAVAAADVDGDGDDEYAVRTGSSIHILESNNSFGFTLTSTIPMPAAEYGTLNVADLDSDGALDLIAFTSTALPNTPGLTVIRNRGNGTFEAPITTVSASDARSISVGDVNSDQFTDIVISSYISSTTSNLAIHHGPFFPCRADVNCDDIVDFFDYADFVQTFANGTSAADFNGDGVVDLFDYLDFVAAFARGC